MARGCGRRRGTSEAQGSSLDNVRAVYPGTGHRQITRVRVRETRAAPLGRLLLPKLMRRFIMLVPVLWLSRSAPGTRVWECTGGAS